MVAKQLQAGPLQWQRDSDLPGFTAELDGLQLTEHLSWWEVLDGTHVVAEGKEASTSEARIAAETAAREHRSGMIRLSADTADL